LGDVNSTTSVKLIYKKVGCFVNKPFLPNTETSTGLVTLGAGILVLGASYALLKSIRSVSRKRILKPVINGKIKNIKLTAEQMNKIDENIIKYFTKS